MSKTYNSRVQFPSDSDYIIRVTNATHAPGKTSGNPMFTVEWELVSPATKEIVGESYTMAGLKSNPMNHLYYVTKTVGNDEKSAGNLERLFSDGEQKGFLRHAFPEEADLMEKSFDAENPSADICKGLKGKLFYVQMSADVSFQRKNPTPAQIEEAKAKKVRPEGDIQTHPVTGDKLVTYLPKVREIFGLAPEGATKAGGAY